MPEQTSLGKLMTARGIDDWDILSNAICGKCSIRPLCDAASEMKSKSGCYAQVIISTLAMKMANGNNPALQNFAEMIREEIQ